MTDDALKELLINIRYMDEPELLAEFSAMAKAAGDRYPWMWYPD